MNRVTGVMDLKKITNRENKGFNQSNGETDEDQERVTRRKKRAMHTCTAKN